MNMTEKERFDLVVDLCKLILLWDCFPNDKIQRDMIEIRIRQVVRILQRKEKYTQFQKKYYEQNKEKITEQHKIAFIKAKETKKIHNL